MATTSLNLSKLFEQQFGVRPERFPFEGLVEQTKFSSIGSAFYEPGKLDRAYFMPVTLGDVKLHNPIIALQSKKTIVETQMTERRGTVKQIINQGNYEITIQGFVIGSNKHDYPEEDIATLRDLYERQEAVTISSAITDIFLAHRNRQGYDRVVITEMAFPEVKGTKNVRPYKLQLVSDEPISLIEKGR